MIQQLQMYLSVPFVQYALIVGVLIALCSSLLGVPLVLKRFSFIGDGLSHVAFGAMAIAGILRLNNDMLFVLPATVLCAILLLRTGQNTRIKGDAAIAMISVGSGVGSGVASGVGSGVGVSSGAGSGVGVSSGAVSSETPSGFTITTSG